MIVYMKFWETLKDRNISQYELVIKYGVSKGLLDRLRKASSWNLRNLLMIKLFTELITVVDSDMYI